MAHLIECPSGLTFHARKLKGSEANLFTDKQVVRKGHLIGRILDATFEGLVDPGPYQIKERPSWDKLLTGDRLVGLVQVRVGTYGPVMDFRVQCTHEACRKRFPVDLNLVDDLVHRPLSDDDREAYEHGNRLESFVVDGDGRERKVVFHLMTGDDERKLARVSERAPDRQITASLAQRINEIEDVHKNDVIRFLDSIDLDQLQALVERLDEHDCGIDTDIEVECEHCGHYMEVQVPLGGKEFFLPDRKRQAREA